MLRTVALAALVLLSCHREAVRPPVILISIDTLRSDHLPAYGYRGIATPNIDRIARDGIVYEHAFAHVPLTLPSHASLFTGMLPTEHGVRDNAGYRLDPKTATIASMLKAHGYATGAAVSAYVLRAETNIGTGFDSYDDRILFVEGAPTGNLQRKGRETLDAARQWLGTRTAEQPFFLFTHFFEPHAPYEPSYDAEIVASDALVGELLATLGTRYDDALIVVLSDHGEGLRDHGEQEHGVLLYREALQVPLIVKLPKNARKGTRVAAPVQLIDVLATIAEITGAPKPATARGTSLMADQRPQTTIYSETHYPRIHLGWSDLKSLIRWPHHLIDGPKPEVYDVAADPRETHDVHEGERRVLARLRQDLAAIPQPALTRPRVDPEEARKLAALGYVTAGAPPARGSVNPREHLADLDALKSVTEASLQRRYGEAIAVAAPLLARNPGWSDLRDQLGQAYAASGDTARAEQTYRDGIRVTPELAPAFALSLAAVLLDQGKLDEAEAHARVALPSNPPGAHEMLATIAFGRGDYDTALAEAQAMRASPSHELNADFLIAQISKGRGELDTALSTLERIHNVSRDHAIPLPRHYWYVTGDVLASLSRPRDAIDAFERELRIEPGNREAWIRLALVHRINGDEAQSSQTLDRMCTAAPGPDCRALRDRLLQQWQAVRKGP
ncbi:MAG TPA: sulfatase-like hydrolase/transferase [Thermoanaerobaculia bacterium]|jgi:arylsulfatase A-like enzyme/cytochrome c-type biogenesis protein CcmH/NrfG